MKYLKDPIIKKSRHDLFEVPVKKSELSANTIKILTRMYKKDSVIPDDDAEACEREVAEISDRKLSLSEEFASFLKSLQMLKNPLK